MQHDTADGHSPDELQPVRDLVAALARLRNCALFLEVDALDFDAPDWHLHSIAGAICDAASDVCAAAAAVQRLDVLELLSV